MVIAILKIMKVNFGRSNLSGERNTLLLSMRLLRFAHNDVLI